eukprot:CAMPEP_0181211016 /NCGR_PEP_ID=MMETSP1096-20121128/23555_1 /TAXON_ID=156174 ORGANISM="Chrysochromulina ericina, Strain CCMP281" /NCGR_SAMPLE_ID=MMETSP1096 /ASSEMBLY_ACC=CAM_ASM_000453 /LENGTH=104 /DNA_ID=CAMNT_0023302377 /DNA_START=170 /DNA_END=485 /DNA_ORIENTATION=-
MATLAARSKMHGDLGWSLFELSTRTLVCSSGQHERQPGGDESRSSNGRKPSISAIAGQSCCIAAAAEYGDPAQEQAAREVRSWKHWAHGQHDAMQHVEALSILK